MNKLTTAVGAFFFKRRNIAFPLIMLAAYVLFRPTNQVAGSRVLEVWKDVAAVAVVAAGSGLRLWVAGLAYIKRGGVNRQVYADRLITQGMFGVGRNPLYIGNLLICFGIFLLHGHPAVVIGCTALFAAIYQCIVLTEEAYLRAKFGEEYEAYCRQTPRWGLRFSAYKEATEGMALDLRKALLVDYTSLSNAVGMVALTALYKELLRGEDAQALHLWLIGGALALTVVWALSIRIYKKSAKLRARPA